MKHARFNLYVIAGPNGAGKTTFADQFLPHYAHCPEFVNADMIAKGLSPYSPAAAAIEAGRLMLGRIKELAAQRKDFGFETTLSGKTYISLFKKLRAYGYRVHLFYLWLPNVDTALQRIRYRVQRGGHSVPESDVRRRFKRSLANLFGAYYPLLDSWFLLDNSDQQPHLIALEKDGARNVLKHDLFLQIQEGLNPS
ncbi:MAG: hypothetical protein A2992_00415 [Elusimicrobia bacterium RIFCSPLOWO2_01_FULL_59_12]|nr:MAG: hypothetical protein A2992_00415 [Elusimicrobia bacterium RIFCSPLOWO2_01_FULL_59_12]